MTLEKILGRVVVVLAVAWTATFGPLALWAAWAVLHYPAG